MSAAMNIQKIGRMLKANKGYYLLSGIAAVPLILMILTPKNPYGWGLFGLLFVRILLFRKKEFLLLTGLLALITVLITSYHYKQNVTHLAAESTHLQLILDPNDYKIKGEQLSGIGVVQQQNAKTEKTAFFYRIQTDEEADFWLQLNKPVRIDAAVSLKEPQQNRNLYQFNYREYLLHKKIHWNTQIKQMDKIQVEKGIPAKISGIRLRFLAILQKRIPEGKLSQYTQAMLFNEKDALHTEVIESYQKIGVMHLFSISGMHIHYLIKYLNDILLRLKVTKEKVRPILLFSIVIYGLLVGGGIGVFRAICTNGLILLAEIFHMQIERKDAFSFSLLFALWLDPYLLFSLGFQLSYSLSGILYILGPRLQESEKPFLVQEFTLSLLMTCASFPFLSYHFYEIPWMGVLNNILFSFFFSRYLFPLFWIAVFLAVSSFSFLLSILDRMVQTILEAAEVLAEKLASSGWLRMITGRQAVFFYLLLSICLLSFFVVLEKKRKWNIPAVFLFFSFLIFYFLPSFDPSGKVVVLDVGQGDAVLFVSPFQRQVVLVDTGGKAVLTKKEKSSWAADIAHDKKLVSALKAEGIRKLDAVILTHSDFDHIGSLGYLAQELPIGALYFSPGSESNPAFQEAVLKLHKKHTKLFSVLSPERLSFGSLHFEVLWPVIEGKAENNDSIVLLTKVGGLVWLLTGDLEAEGERSLLQRYPHLECDVLKIGHHGSHTSTIPAFLNQMSPSIAIISAGQNNFYGHPHEDVLNRLEQKKMLVYRTDQQGAIHFVYKGRQQKWLYVLQ